MTNTVEPGHGERRRRVGVGERDRLDAVARLEGAVEHEHGDVVGVLVVVLLVLVHGGDVELLAVVVEVDDAGAHREVLGVDVLDAVGGGEDDVHGEQRAAAHDRAELLERDLPGPLAGVGLLAAHDGAGRARRERDDAAQARRPRTASRRRIVTPTPRVGPGVPTSRGGEAFETAEHEGRVQVGQLPSGPAARHPRVDEPAGGGDEDGGGVARLPWRAGGTRPRSRPAMKRSEVSLRFSRRSASDPGGAWPLRRAPRRWPRSASTSNMAVIVPRMRSSKVRAAGQGVDDGPVVAAPSRGRRGPRAGRRCCRSRRSRAPC